MNEFLHHDKKTHWSWNGWREYYFPVNLNRLGRLFRICMTVCGTYLIVASAQCESEEQAYSHYDDPFFHLCIRLMWYSRVKTNIKHKSLKTNRKMAGYSGLMASARKSPAAVTAFPGGLLYRQSKKYRINRGRSGKGSGLCFQQSVRWPVFCELPGLCFSGFTSVYPCRVSMAP